MSNSLKKAQAYCLEHTPDIKNICESLFKSTPITQYGLSRIYHDGKTLSVASNQKWLNAYYQNHISPVSSVIECPQMLTRRYSYWNDLINCKAVQLASKQFPVDNGFTIIVQNANYTDFNHFCAESSSESILSWYINHIEILMHFNYYFISQLATFNEKQLKTNADGQLFKQYKSIYQLAIQKQTLLRQQVQQFMKSTPIRQVTLYYRGEAVTLTQREVECLICLIQGCTAKKTGELLHLSQRTVESHLAKCKTKFNVHYKTQLVDVASDLINPTILHV